MFGLGISEIIVIVIAALIFVGPKQLPAFIQSAGKFFVQIRRATNEVKSTVDGVIREAEDDLRREAKSITDTVDTKAITATATEIQNTLKTGLEFQPGGMRSSFSDPAGLVGLPTEEAPKPDTLPPSSTNKSQS
jgi:sec-independent protein translocase protein TatB